VATLLFAVHVLLKEPNAKPPAYPIASYPSVSLAATIRLLYGLLYLYVSVAEPDERTTPFLLVQRTAPRAVLPGDPIALAPNDKRYPAPELVDATAQRFVVNTATGVGGDVLVRLIVVVTVGGATVVLLFHDPTS
jgi:hypothetical protein